MKFQFSYASPQMREEKGKNFSTQWTELNAFQKHIDSDDAANHEKCSFLGCEERQFKIFLVYKWREKQASSFFREGI